MTALHVRTWNIRKRSKHTAPAKYAGVSRPRRFASSSAPARSSSAPALSSPLLLGGRPAFDVGASTFLVSPPRGTPLRHAPYVRRTRRRPSGPVSSVPTLQHDYPRAVLHVWQGHWYVGHPLALFPHAAAVCGTRRLRLGVAAEPGLLAYLCA